jgi:hypothetical protein
MTIYPQDPYVPPAFWQVPVALSGAALHPGQTLVLAARNVRELCSSPRSVSLQLRARSQDEALERVTAALEAAEVRVEEIGAPIRML